MLAGGHGTRLRPITDSIPKCLVPIRGRPLLDIWLDLCERSGITEVLLNLHAHAEVIERHVQRRRPAVRVHLVREEQLLGSAGTIAANRAWIGPDSMFWVLYSDVLTATDLNRMSDFHRRHGKLASLGLYEVADPARCGIAVSDQAGVIVDFQEKPRAPRSQWAFSGLMVASRELLDYIPSTTPADIGFDVLPRLVGRMMAYPISDYLLDVGTVANYERAQETWRG